MYLFEPGVWTTAEVFENLSPNAKFSEEGYMCKRARFKGAGSPDIYKSTWGRSHSAASYKITFSLRFARSHVPIGYKSARQIPRYVNGKAQTQFLDVIQYLEGGSLSGKWKATSAVRCAGMSHSMSVGLGSRGEK